MKILLLLFFIGCSAAVWAQGMVTNSLELVSSVTHKVEQYPSDTDLFLAIQGDARSIEFRFTPGGDASGDNTGWEYRFDGGNIVEYPNSDSSYVVFQLSQDGQYTVEASKLGEISISQTFRVFFADVNEAEMTVEISDKDDCDFFKLKLNGYNREGYNDSYYGNESVLYAINERWLAVGANPITTPVSEKASKEDKEYRIKVKDGFGFVWTSQPVEYESVIPEAIPTIKLLNTVDIVGEAGDEMGQAPLEVEFNTDECVNADTYQWFLYKDTSTMVNTGADLLDSLIDGQIRYENYFTYIYEKTGKYKVLLVATNTVGNQCTDTSEIKYVNVVESLVDVPNVFTPNGDGKNDVFKVLALSVESFHGIIINRWGRKVYEWSDPTGGWDGRINGRYANPGTYYYIITARGLEVSSPRYVKKGALMLIR